MVRVADKTEEGTGGKRFLGAFVEQDDGTRWVVTYRAESPFVGDDGTPFWLAHGGEKVELGKPVTLTAYRVEPSRHIARVGGPYLWIVDIEAR